MPTAFFEAFSEGPNVLLHCIPRVWIIVFFRPISRSEHERHAVQCPYIRGEYTDNVPLEETEASCPAYHCLQREGEGDGGEEPLLEEKGEGKGGGGGGGGGDRIICLGTSLGTELVAIGTECGRVILLDMENGVLIMVNILRPADVLCSGPSLPKDPQKLRFPKLRFLHKHSILSNSNFQTL